MTRSTGVDDDVDLTWNTEPSPAHPQVALLLGGSLLGVVLICVLPLFVVDDVRGGGPAVLLAAISIIAGALGVGPFVSARLQTPAYVPFALATFDLLPLVVVWAQMPGNPARSWCSVLLIPVLLTAATHTTRFYRAQFVAGCLAGLPILIGHAPTAWEALLTSVGYVFFIVVCASLTRRYWLVLHERFEQLRRRSHTDELTGLLNRRGFIARFPEVRHRAVERGVPLGLALIDIDHFSRINVEHGHAYGDAVLRDICREVSTLSALSVPSECLIARIGGEELVVVSAGAVGPVAEAIRRAVADTQPHPGLTLSMGISDSDPRLCTGPASLWQLVKAADRAMYRAKESGRDRIVRVVPEDVEPAGRPERDPWPPTPRRSPALPSPGRASRWLSGAGAGTAVDDGEDDPTGQVLLGAYCLVFAAIGALAFVLGIAINPSSNWVPVFLGSLVVMALLGVVAVRGRRIRSGAATTMTIVTMEVCTLSAVLATPQLEHRLMIICVITVPVVVAAQTTNRWGLVSQYLLVILGVGLAAYDGTRPMDAAWLHRTISMTVVISAAPAVLHWLRRRRELANAQLRTLSATDPLTGVLNRAGLEAAVLERHPGGADGVAGESAGPAGGAVAGRLHVILANIDDFKSVNDTFGHVFGDQALIGLSDNMFRTVTDHQRVDSGARSRSARRVPGTPPAVLVARTGGDRFVVVMPAPPDRALLRLVRRAVTALPGISVSFGVAEAVVSTGSGLWALIAAAEADLARSRDERRSDTRPGTRPKT